MIKKSSALYIGALLLFCIPLSAQANWQGYVAFDLGLSHLKGYSQIPKGGNFGTSSLKRPSFEETHCKQDSFYHLETGAGIRDYGLSLGYNHFAPDGNTLLDSPLLTHAKSIPVNSLFYMKADFDLFSLKLDKCLNYKTWQLKPGISGQWLKYDYTFFAKEQSSQRRFSAFAPAINLGLEHALSSKWTFDLQGISTLNLSNLNLWQANAALSYLLYQNEHFKFKMQGKAGCFILDFKDKQPFPNHVRYEGLPFASIGILMTLK